MPAALKIQRTMLAACIILAPLSISLFVLAWPENPAPVVVAWRLVGWIPWSALIGIDDLAYDIAQTGSTPQFAALWLRFNGDTVMVTYLLIYIIGHLLSAVLIAIMLGRLRLVPVWAAW